VLFPPTKERELKENKKISVDIGHCKASVFGIIESAIGYLSPFSNASFLGLLYPETSWAKKPFSLTPLAKGNLKNVQ